MKAEPKLADLLNVLIPQIEQLKETIQITVIEQKKTEENIKKLSETNLKPDISSLEFKLNEFQNSMQKSLEKIVVPKAPIKEKTFISTSDFKILLLALVSAFCFGVAVMMIVNQHTVIKKLKAEITLLKTEKATKQ